MFSVTGRVLITLVCKIKIGNWSLAAEPYK